MIKNQMKHLFYTLSSLLIIAISVSCGETKSNEKQKEELIEQDQVELIDILDISSADLVDRFDDRVEDKFDELFDEDNDYEKEET